MEIIVSLLMIALSFVYSRIEKTSYMQLLYELCICNHYIQDNIYELCVIIILYKANV